MERGASALGRSLSVPEIITGGLVLAAVTSLPNAVAAVYLARRGRGAATLSTALNSNTLNVIAGLLLPGAVLGLGAPSGQALLVTAWYAALTLAVLALAWRHQGLSAVTALRSSPHAPDFTASLIISDYAAPGGNALVIGLSVLSAVVLAAAMAPGARRVHRDARGQVKPAVTGQMPARGTAAARRRGSLLPGWTAQRLWVISMIATSSVAVVDAATGPRVVLIGLLAVGPCITLLTGWWLPAVVSGVWACGLAVPGRRHGTGRLR